MMDVDVTEGQPVPNMSPVTLFSTSLGATLRGARPTQGVWQFRNLQYATIPSRFADPEPPRVLAGDVDSTVYGPRCPQNHIDFGHMLRIPPEQTQAATAAASSQQDDDEFECLNLDITMPCPSSSLIKNQQHPVMVWIHGGSQAVTFGDASSGLCDPTSLVARSVQRCQRIIVVTVNYRLNMFAFGDLASGKNLALKDQQRALDYVRVHIRDFGGDPTNITIAGESAGAVFCHAHLLIGSPARQCILQSGTLHLSPPQPRATAEALIRKVGDAVAALGDWDLRTVPVAKLLEAQAAMGLVSFFLQEDEPLRGWHEGLGQFARLMIGDAEYESALWRNGIEICTPDFISDAFEAAGVSAPRLKALYGIVKDRPVSCKIGALDFLNDARFSLPIETLMGQCIEAKRPVFRFLVDQSNPWQPSSRAHHGVDLLFLFDGFAMPSKCSAQKISRVMQDKWIQFVQGKDPWQPGTAFAFGPLGQSCALTEDELLARRRREHVESLVATGLAEVEAIVRTLATGRSSLLN